MKVLQSKGIVHRDLKPQNILLSHSGVSHPKPADIKIKIGRLNCQHNLLLSTYLNMLVHINTIHICIWAQFSTQGGREGGNLPRAPSLKGGPDLGANVKLSKAP